MTHKVTMVRVLGATTLQICLIKSHKYTSVLEIGAEVIFILYFGKYHLIFTSTNLQKVTQLDPEKNFLCNFS